MALTFFYPQIIGVENPIIFALTKTLSRRCLPFKMLSLKSDERATPVVVPNPILMLIPDFSCIKEIQLAQDWIKQAESSDMPVMLVSSLGVLKSQDNAVLDEQVSDYAKGKEAKALRKLEKTVQALPKSIILRVGQLVSLRKPNVLTELLERVEQTASLELNDSLQFNPTPVNHIAQVIVAILQQASCVDDVWGLYHFGGETHTSLYGLAEYFFSKVKEHEDLPELELIKTPSDDAWLLKHAVARTDNSKLFDTFGIRPKPWREGVSKIIRFYYGQDE